MNDLERYSSEELTEADRRRVRRDSQRVDEIYPIFGPVAQIVRNWRYLIATVAVVVFLGSDRGRAVLAAISEVLP